MELHLSSHVAENVDMVFWIDVQQLQVQRTRVFEFLQEHIEPALSFDQAELIYHPGQN